MRDTFGAGVIFLMPAAYKLKAVKDSEFKQLMKVSNRYVEEFFLCIHSGNHRGIAKVDAVMP